MGNEGSSLKAHASLVSGDGDSLKASLAGGANNSNSVKFYI